MARGGGIKIQTTFQHGQFYAVASGREVARLKGGGRRRNRVASMGPTPEAAIADVARLLDALRRSAEREQAREH